MECERDLGFDGRGVRVIRRCRGITPCNGEASQHTIILHSGTYFDNNRWSGWGRSTPPPLRLSSGEAYADTQYFDETSQGNGQDRARDHPGLAAVFKGTLHEGLGRSRSNHQATGGSAPTIGEPSGTYCGRGASALECSKSPYPTAPS